MDDDIRLSDRALAELTESLDGATRAIEGFVHTMESWRREVESTLSGKALNVYRALVASEVPWLQAADIARRHSVRSRSTR